MKPLVLLSFSLTFLTQGFADDSSAMEPSDQVNVEEQSGDQVMVNDSFAVEPSEQVSDEEQPQASMSMESEDAQWCLSPYHEMHASIRHNEANGIGYKEGYTTLEAFGIYDGWGSGFMPFVDLRGHVFNNGKLAGNVGIGERTLFTSINHTFGSYLYYDVRRVGHHLTVNQLSPGIELVGERMEYRINGYFPVGKNKGNKFGYAFDRFTGNNILLKFKQNQAMMGGDAEVGVHIPQNTTYDVYAAAGPYYFHSSNASAWGGKARLLGRYKEYVTLEVAYSYDKLFRNVVQGSVAFAMPFGRKLQRCGKCCPQTDNLLLSRAAFAPSRFEIPVVKAVHRKEKAINPATGQPWFVWFVNNTSHSAGTFESPFPTLAQAQNASSPNNMIYVFPGNGTTTGMSAGITLKNGQNFFGSGIKQQFATTKGTMTIPVMSSTNPTITNVTGNVVTLGNGNVVSGFNITSSTAAVNGIDSPVSGVNGATIINNVITFTGAANGIGIRVLGFGACNISNNQITNSVVAGNGIGAESVGGVMRGVVSNNSISGLTNGIGFSDLFGGSSFTVEGNTISNFSGDGIFANMNGESVINIIGNTLNNSHNFINAIEANETTLGGINFARVLIENNTIVVTSTNATSGIIVDTTLHSLPRFLTADITNNSVQSSVGTGFTNFDVRSTDKVAICLSLDNNTAVTVSGGTGYGFTATAPGVINIDSIQGNVGGPVASTGDVNLVAPGTCGN